jgi:hypothetical protein
MCSVSIFRYAQTLFSNELGWLAIDTVLHSAMRDR